MNLRKLFTIATVVIGTIINPIITHATIKKTIDKTQSDFIELMVQCQKAIGVNTLTKSNDLASDLDSLFNYSATKRLCKQNITKGNISFNHLVFLKNKSPNPSPPKSKWRLKTFPLSSKDIQQEFVDILTEIKLGLPFNATVCFAHTSLFTALNIYAFLKEASTPYIKEPSYDNLLNLLSFCAVIIWDNQSISKKYFDNNGKLLLGYKASQNKIDMLNEYIAKGLIPQSHVLNNTHNIQNDVLIQDKLKKCRAVIAKHFMFLPKTKAANQKQPIADIIIHTES